MAASTNNALDVAVPGGVFHAAQGKAGSAGLDVAVPGGVFHVWLALPPQTGSADVTATVSASQQPGLVSPLSGTQASPVTFTWRGYVDAGGRPVHYRLQTAATGNLGTTNLLDVSSVDTSFEYDSSAGSDGTGPWLSLPLDGLIPANQGRRVRVALANANGATDWRVRQEAILGLGV